MNNSDENFPTGHGFLTAIEQAADSGSLLADSFFRSSGEKLPASIDGFGNLLSLLYRGACCSWGCRGGDHQIEWLTGRVVNQAMSSYRLMRAGYYDESLMLTRGITEIANLMWLFRVEDASLEQWKRASRSDRLRDFGPAAVRKRLEAIVGSAPIEHIRYQRLCEIGSHPTPGVAPGHYNGTGRPILGVMLQPAGVLVAANELCLAAAICGAAAGKLLGLEHAREKTVVQQGVTLLRSLGAFTILNYSELIQESLTERPETP